MSQPRAALLQGAGIGGCDQVVNGVDFRGEALARREHRHQIAGGALAAIHQPAFRVSTCQVWEFEKVD